MLVNLAVQDLISHGNVRVEIGNVSTLAASIAEHGIIQPPIVVATNDESGTYVIVTGHRRIAAAKELGLSMIDVIVDDAVDASEIIAIQYAENMERNDLTAYEQCQVAWDLKLEGLNQADVAKAMGLSKGDVARYHKTAKHVALIEPSAAIQLTHDGLFDLVEHTTPETASDVLDVVLEGVHIQSAVRQVEATAEIIAFYETVGPMQKEWAEAGVKVQTEHAPDKDLDNPNAWGNGYGRLMNVRLIRELGIEEKDHISLPCHAVWINADVGNHRPPSVSHWCTDVKSHTPTKSRTPDVVSPVAVKDTKVRESSSAERREQRDAKKLRIRQGAKWLLHRTKAADREAWANDRALMSWLQEDVRAACDMLELSKDRPKGSEFDWYDKALNTWMDEQFGDNTLARDRFRVQVMIAQKYINGGWGMNADFMSQLQDIKVTDE